MAIQQMIPKFLTKMERILLMILLHFKFILGQAIGISYCINTTQPELHSYCTTYQMSADGFVTSQGNFVGSAGNCTLTVDDQVCNACAIQTDCQTQNGKQLPGPGESSNDECVFVRQ